MSIHILDRIWKQSDYGGSKRLLLLAIADNANEEGVAWPGLKYLAAKTKLSRRQVMRLVQELANDGTELQVAWGRGRGNTHIYYVLTGMSDDERRRAKQSLHELMQEDSPVRGGKDRRPAPRIEPAKQPEPVPAGLFYPPREEEKGDNLTPADPEKVTGCPLLEGEKGDRLSPITNGKGDIPALKGDILSVKGDISSIKGDIAVSPEPINHQLNRQEPDIGFEKIPKDAFSFSPKQAWEIFLEQMRNDMQPFTFDRWLRPVVFESWSDGQLTLRARDATTHAVFVDRFLSSASRIISGVLRQPVSVQVGV